MYVIKSTLLDFSKHTRAVLLHQKTQDFFLCCSDASSQSWPTLKRQLVFDI